jgi:hypothetical protein
MTGISYLNFVSTDDTTPTNPASVIGQISQNDTTMYIGSETANSGIVVDIQGSSVLINGSAIATGGNVSNNQDNIFQPGYTQTFQGSTVIDNSALYFTNNATIPIGLNGYIYFPTTFPTGTSGGNAGLSYFWNKSNGGGEVSMICYAQGAGGALVPEGGLEIYTANSSPYPPQLLASFLYNSSSISTNPTMPTSTNIGNATSSNTATTYWVNSYFAPISSPSFSGTPLAPTPILTDNGTAIATTAFVKNQNYAPLASPTFTGTPLSTTPTTGDDSTKIATTAFVNSSITATGFAPINSPNFTGNPTAPTVILTDNSFAIATTAFVKNQNYAPLASPAFTGNPTAVTQPLGNITTQIATTAFVQNAITNAVNKFNITSDAGTSSATNTFWNFTFPLSFSYGNTFSYVITTNSTQTSTGVVTPLTLNNSYGIIIGNGVNQPYFYNGFNGNGYVLSVVNTMGLQLSYTGTTVYSSGGTSNSGSRIQIQTVSGISSISTLSMTIITTS